MIIIGNKIVATNGSDAIKAGDVIKLEVCDKCHPFFTGQQKLVDTEGRVDKFNKKHNLK